jgi:hypothetical protein
MFNTRRARTASAFALALILTIVQPAYGLQTPSQPTTQEQAAAAFASGVTLHDAGKFAEAVEAFDRAEKMGYQPINQVRFRKARSYAKAGDTERALTTLEQLAAAGFANTAVLTMPDLNALRELPRYKAFESRVKANARPCDADPNYHAFDFWIGEWDVQPTGAQRGPIGSGASSVIERQLDGCVIQENWLPPGPGAGKSFNIYNNVTKQWEQYYVDARGTITHYTGTFHDDGNLYFEATQFGTSSRIRMTFFNQGPSQVRQLGHISNDGGKTWTVTFDLTYMRKKT